MKIVGVNGIYSNGLKSTDLLLNAIHTITDDEIVAFKTGLRLVTTSMMDAVNAQDAARLIKLVEPGDVVIAHSRGSVVTWHACGMGMRPAAVFLFSGAMESNIPWDPDSCNKIYNIYNPHDWILKVGSDLPGSIFGTLGLHGYDGPTNNHIINIDGSKLQPDNSYLNPHSEYFNSKNVNFWAEVIRGLIQ